MKRVELLSPVGNKEMLYQAIHNGADAVYLAGKSYGARKFSNNFTNLELVEAIKYSHLYGVLVYVTVNTVIYEYEIDDFIKYIEFLYVNGVDAVIMQDIGMIKLVREKFPNLEVHASTQCHNHNEEGINLLKEFGCTRVVMAREMSLDEINKIDVPIEKEVFVYGALCVCYSGCCLFSSLNGGRSGNRGECTQCCRLPFKLVKNNSYVDLDGSYLLSTKELNTLDKLKDILDSNIDSLKIEGRMKSPYYVGYVTRLYRMLIDKYYDGLELKLSDEELNNLKKIFNREFTCGYLFRDKSVMNIKSPNHIGVSLGKVIRIDRKYIYIKLDSDINQEDGIRFKNSDKGMMVNRLYNKNGLLVNSVSKGNICCVDNKMKIKNNDIVLKTMDSKLVKELDNYSLKKISVSFRARFKLGEKFRINISDGINIIEEYGDRVEVSIRNSVTKEDIVRGISKLGNTPFVSSSIDIDMDDNIFISLKSINEVRRKLVDRLIDLRSNKKRDIIINDIKDKEDYIVRDNKYYLNVLVRNEEQLRACIDNMIDNIYVCDYELYKKYSYLYNIYYRCDRVNNKYMDITDSKLLVGELGSIYKYRNNNYLVGDYYLNVTNSKSILCLNDLGVDRVTLSVELDKSKIKDIMDKVSNIELIIYGRLELMVMKYCPLKECLNYCSRCNNSSDKFSLEDRDGNRYPIIHDKCVTHIMYYKNIDYISDIDEYKKMGVNNYRIELFDEDYKMVEKCIQKIKKVL